MPEIKLAWDNNNPENISAYLHTNVLLIPGLTSRYYLFDDKKPGAELLRSVLQIHGVQDASVDRYKVRVERTRVVEWPTICAAVEQAVLEYCHAVTS